MQDRDEAAERLQSLHELRGPDLVTALIKELGELHRHVVQLQREMTAYRDYQAARDRWLVIDTVQQSRVQLPKAVTIDASQSLHPRQGFYGLEYGARGTPFSWTGPAQNFSFDVFVERRQGATLELRALSCINFEKQKGIKLFANGEEVPTTVSRNGTGLLLNADIPARDDDRGTNLVFWVPAVLKPTGAGDKRTLGIAFSSLTVQSLTGKPEIGTKTAPPTDTVVSMPRPQAAKKPEEAAQAVPPAPASDVAAS
jgi:hypothetical protein